MAIEDRRGECATCDGPIRRVPNLLPDTPDKYVHDDPADWRGNPHDPTPKVEP